MVENLSWKKKMIVFGMGLLLVLGLGSYGYLFFSFKDKVFYIYFDTSISGLKEGSAVTYQGVDIGTVSSIAVELPDADVIKVAIKVKKNFPIYSNYRASLSMRGFSGYNVIDLKKDLSFEQKLLNSGDCIISEADDMYGSLRTLIKEVSVLLKKVNESLSVNDLQMIRESLLRSVHNIEKSSENILDVGKNALAFSGNFNEHMILAVKSLNDIVDCFQIDYQKGKLLLFSKVYPILNSLDVMAKKMTVNAKGKKGAWKFFG